MSDEFERTLATRMQYPSNACLALSQGQLAHTISEDISSLEWDDVILAIAAMWQGIAGADLFYSFGNAESFQIASSMTVAPDYTCVPSSDTLIIPMDSGAVVIALSEPSNNGLVRFILLQSTAGNAPQIRRDARAIVENAQWSADSDPRFVNSSDQWVTAPTAIQHNDINTARHHVVLNAWAYMLDIPIAKAMRDLNEEETNQFYSQIQFLMNLAFNGRLDRELVRAFMHEYGYDEESTNPGAVRRIQDDRQRGLLEHARSVLINPMIFADILAALRADSNTRHIKTTISPATLHNPSNMSTQSGSLPPPPRAVAPGAGPPSPGTLIAAGNWREILDNNLRIFERRVQALPKPDSKILDRRIEVPDSHNYHDLHVELSIHSVWYPLLKQNHLFAMGDGTTYAQRDLERAQEFNAWANGDTSMPFIMPLRGQLPSFRDTQLAKGGRYHWILAVAEMDKTDNQQVNIRILNSMPSTGRGIRTAAEKVVKYSGWLGVDRDRLNPLPADVTFTHEVPVVPGQYGQPACGFHTIMAAWATMLGIPINPARTLRDRGNERKEFYAIGTRIVNCALAGCMNSRTIQAFLNVYGFSVEQALGEQCTDIDMSWIMTQLRFTRDHLAERNRAKEAQEQEELDNAMALSIAQEKEAMEKALADSLNTQ